MIIYSMLKRGQITLFVVLGIIIIAVIALGLFFRTQFASVGVTKEAAELSALPPDLSQLREDISDCAKQISEEALFIAGQQGGYYTAPDNALKLGLFPIALGVENNAKVLVSENKLKEETAAYIQNFLPGCVDFNNYNNFEILDQSPDTEINLNEDNTELSITYRITATNKDNSYTINEPYDIKLPLRVKTVYETSSKIADDLIASKDEFDATKILSYGLDVELYPLSEGMKIVYVTDKNDNAERNYEFVFGVVG